MARGAAGNFAAPCFRTVTPALRLVSLPALGPSLPRRGNAFTRALGRGVLRLLGWDVEGTLPDTPRFVLIGAPHTSNWDGIVGLATALAIGLGVHVFAKQELFRFPTGPLLRALGGVPIDRSAGSSVVERAVQTFSERERFVLAISPEGTRRKVDTWKTGFYRIALGAGVPVAAVAFDWDRKRIHGLGTVVPTGDLDADVAALRALYVGINGKHPALQTL